MLTQPQFERVEQIQWQAAGSEFLADPEHGKALTISNEQRETIIAVRREYQSNLIRMVAQASANRVPPQEQLINARKLESAYELKATQVLTQEQQVKYKELRGSPFDVYLLQ